MKSTESTWFRKYRDDYLRVADILRNTDAEELVSNMEWFDNEIISKSHSETCKISLLRHGGNLPVYVDLKEDDHTKYHYL